MVLSVDSLEIFEFLWLSRTWEEVFPRTIAESEGELHCLWCDADVHRTLDRFYAVRHVGDDFALLRLVLAFQRKHKENDAFPCVLEDILC